MKDKNEEINRLEDEAIKLKNNVSLLYERLAEEQEKNRDLGQELVEKVNELAASVSLVELRDKQLSDSENLVEKLKAGDPSQLLRHIYIHIHFAIKQPNYTLTTYPLTDNNNNLLTAVVDLEAAMERVELDLTERNTKIMLLQVTDPFSQANPYTFSYLPLYT